MSAPLVSVIIPCFNQGRFLVRAIESVLEQSFQDFEIIVVNDGSSDETEQVAKGFGSKILYLEKPNAGLSAARNTGILSARGAYLVFLDADDLLDNEMLRHMTEASAQNP